MSSSVAAIIPAAGLGTRMGGNLPKQYLRVDGIPLLVYSLRIFEAIESISEVILAVPEADRNFVREGIVNQYRINKVSQVVAGGRATSG